MRFLRPSLHSVAELALTIKGQGCPIDAGEAAVEVGYCLTVPQQSCTMATLVAGLPVCPMCQLQSTRGCAILASSVSGHYQGTSQLRKVQQGLVGQHGPFLLVNELLPASAWGLGAKVPSVFSRVRRGVEMEPGTKRLILSLPRGRCFWGVPFEATMVPAGGEPSMSHCSGDALLAVGRQPSGRQFEET